MSDSTARQRPLLAELEATKAPTRVAFLSAGGWFVGWSGSEPTDLGVGPERLTRARALLERPDLTEGSAERSSRLAVVSLTFDPEEPGSVAVLPDVVLRPDDVSQDRSVEPPASTTGPPDDRPRYAGSTVRDDVWLEAVAQALEEIDAGRYDKVVLARDLHLWMRAAFPIDRLLSDLVARFPSCTTFLVDGLIGASPETLIERRGTRIRSRVLAGTARRDPDPEVDARLGAGLLASDKDRREHDLAVRSAVDALAPLCVTLDVPDEPSLVRLDNVQHLGSDLVGELRAGLGGDVPHVLDLVGRLHPTAAVGGAPRGAALDAIGRLEGMSRGRYAGPVGWFDDDGDGEFAIALRCAEVRGDRARLFAGAGIVAGSLPEAELTETWLKLQAMTGILDG